MDWRPEWEPLADALKRVIDAGTLPERARHRICTDIAQDQIRICPYVASETTGKPDVRLRSPMHYRVPHRLEPGDFDWENSRPLQPWSVNRTGHGYGWEDAPIKLIDLKTDDVIDRLCSNSGASVAAKTGTPAERIETARAPGNNESSSRRRGRPADDDDRLARDFKTVLKIAQEEFPDGKPDHLSFALMAERLMDNEKIQAIERWKASSIAKILSGKYPRMKELGIQSPYEKK